MIISRTPFRISFAGGGSDLPSFYREETGAVVSTTIDKYMYLAIHPYFDKSKIQLKYSKLNWLDSIEEIRHPIFREVLSLYNLKGIDLNSIADIPAGTGLGSSSSFTVAC
jgi:D-glycero-alpha-D-manno-heptose-7-phosphate kinase